MRTHSESILLLPTFICGFMKIIIRVVYFFRQIKETIKCDQVEINLNKIYLSFYFELH